MADTYHNGIPAELDDPWCWQEADGLTAKVFRVPGTGSYINGTLTVSVADILTASTLREEQIAQARDYAGKSLLDYPRSELLPEKHCRSFLIQIADMESDGAWHDWEIFDATTHEILWDCRAGGGAYIGRNQNTCGLSLNPLLSAQETQDNG